MTRIEASVVDIIAFPTKTDSSHEQRYQCDGTIGASSGIAVQIMSRIGTPHDLLVVLGGTAEGSTTIAALPAADRDFADVLAYATLAALDAAQRTWRRDSIANG